MQTATKTRTATSTRVKVAVTVGMIGLVAAAAYGFAFAPGFQKMRKPIIPIKVNLNTNVGAIPAGGAGGGGADTRAPLVGVVKPVVAQAGTPVTLTATFSDADSGVATCVLTVDRAYLGTMTLGAITGGSGTASRSYTFSATSTPGTHTAEVRCTDAASNTGSSGVQNISVSSAPAGSSTSTPPSTIDAMAPVVGAFSPTTSTQNVTTTISARATDNVGISSCMLYVGGILQGAMAVSSGVASRSHTFTSAGGYAAFIQCSDAAGNIGNSGVQNITVSAPVTCGPLQARLASASPIGAQPTASGQTVAIFTLSTTGPCDVTVSDMGLVFLNDIDVASSTPSRMVRVYKNSVTAANQLGSDTFRYSSATYHPMRTSLIVPAHGAISVFVTADTQDARADNRLRVSLESLITSPTVTFEGLPVTGGGLVY